MKSRFRLTLIAPILVGAGCMQTTALTLAESSGSVKPIRAKYDATIIDKDIAFWRAKTEYDPTGAIGWSQLSGAYLRRSKESDSMEAAKAAESAARKSLSIRRPGNVGAANKLTSALLEQHRFREALKSASDALSLRPDDALAIQQKISVLIELGRYEEAIAFAKGRPNAMVGPSGLFTQARFFQLKGESALAETLLRKACDAVDKMAGMGRENVSWFHTKLASHLFDSGDIAGASKEFSISLELYPRSYKAMIGMQRVCMANKDWQGVVDRGHKTEEITTMPESLAVMGDAYELLGDKKMAKAHFGEALAAAGLHFQEGATHHHHQEKPHGHPLDRQVTVILADHGWYLPEAIAAAKRDLAERPDAEAKLNLAWAYFQAGKVSLARDQIKSCPDVHISHVASGKKAMILGS